MQRIEDIDPGFTVTGTVPHDLQWFDPRTEPFTVFGLCPNEKGSFCRLPPDMLSQCSEGVRKRAWNLAGGVVRFSTDSARLAILWRLRDKGILPLFAAAAQSGMELFEETDHGAFHVRTIIPQMDDGCDFLTDQSFLCPLPDGMRCYALYLPLYNGISHFHLGFDAGSAVGRGRRPKIKKPLVFYGSSITQGGCAQKAGSCYAAILARCLDAAMINLGFAGSADGGEYMARYIASLSMSAFIMDYDHNAPNVEHLEKTHWRFFEIIRAAQPDLPIVIASRPDFDRDPSDAEARRRIILATYAKALAAGDKNVYYVDGQTFFGSTDRDLCTVDDCHPTDLGFLRMADRFEPVLRYALMKYPPGKMKTI